MCGYSAGGTIAFMPCCKIPNRYLGAMLLSAMPEVSDWWLKLRLTVATGMMRARTGIG